MIALYNLFLEFAVLFTKSDLHEIYSLYHTYIILIALKNAP